MANALALVLCTIFNTVAHRELSRSLEGPAQKRRFVTAVIGLSVVSLLLTTVALVLAQLLAGPALAVALVAVASAYGVSGVIRFTVLRAWVFRPSGTVLSSAVNSFA
jgi:putative flippase GtrA